MLATLTSSLRDARRARFLPALWLALLGVFAGGCGPRIPLTELDVTAKWQLIDYPPPPQGLAAELHVLAAPHHLAPEILKKFEELYHVKIRLEAVRESEVIDERTRTGRYDVVIVATYLVQQWIREKRARPINREAIPNIRYIDSEYFSLKHDPGLKYSLPLYETAVGVAMNMKYVSGLPLTWPEFAAETGNKFARGRVATLDEMRHTMGTALLMLNLSANTRDPAEIARARDFLITTKKQTGLMLRARRLADSLVSEETILAVATNGDAARALRENSNVRFVIPRGPSIVNFNSLCIPANAAHPTTAEFFVNFLLIPEITGALSNFSNLGNTCAQSDAFVSAAIHNGPGYMMPLINDAVFLEDVGDAIKFYLEAWQALNAAPDAELQKIPLPFSRTQFSTK